MATLSLTNTFIAGTLAKASEVNQNFTDLVNWSSGNIQNDNLGTMNGTISWTIATGVKAISIANSGNEGSIGITQSVGLNPNKATIRIIDNAAQTAGDAEIYVSMSSLSSTIPILKLDYAGMQVLAVKNSRIELPVRTLAQRDAISSPANGSILIVEDSPESRHRGLHVKATEGWHMLSVPAGACLPFAGANLPDGWLLCDGSAVSRATYATLFAAIGTTWGVGDGSTTFNLPDMRRRTAIGSGGSAVAGPANTLGSTGGHEQLQAHSHGHSLGTNVTGNHSHGGSTGGVDSSTPTTDWAFTFVSGGGQNLFANAGMVAGESFRSHTHAIGADGNHSHGVTGGINTSGSGNAENMQPSAVFNYIIKW